MVSPWLILLIALTFLFVIYWVLFGERKQKQMLGK